MSRFLILLCYVWYHGLGLAFTDAGRAEYQEFKIFSGEKGTRKAKRLWIRAYLLARDLGHTELQQKIFGKQNFPPPVVHLCRKQGFLEPPWISLGKGSKSPHKHIA